MEAPSILQWVLVTLTTATALVVVMVRNPVVAAMSLMATLFLTGALYFGLGSFFIGAVQILIYAGAISVLFVFVVMLLDLRPFPVKVPGTGLRTILAVVAAVVTLLSLANAILPGLLSPSHPEIEAAAAKSIALRFLSKYMFPFQVTGLLLLSAVVGVVVLARPVKPISVDRGDF